MRERGCPQVGFIHEVEGPSSGVAAERALPDAVGAVLLYAVAAVPLAAVPGAGIAPRLAGVAAGGVIVWAAAASLLRRTPAFSTTADRVTLLRAVLAGLMAVGVVEGLLTGHVPHQFVAAVGTLAFLLDAVDGAVARRTGTANAAGGRLDTSTDAALVLVLSVAAADVTGTWTLCIGAAYYMFTAAGRFWPRLRRPLPRSTARKAIGAAQPFALLLALTPVPRPVAVPVVAVALSLLVFSFARDTVLLARRPSE